MMQITSDEQWYDQVEDDVAVEQGGRLHLNGMVTGRLIVRRGGTAQINGMVGDLVIEQGGYANLHGTCTGSVTNEGELTVAGIIKGQLREGGDATTTVVPGAYVNGQQR
ncbi:hypothetical protein [Williamsia serinedens]|uniref:Polymer-forming cytoskeletal protein n=1 Tax=Williamsia serinedens TaxID=391736 RepID=A0ABT1H7N3_9NOCA|nr:hypothetical protein [Williamsia serinedens]MCP2162640.1 hypothetical protein [Williamsia serinedens]